MIWNLIFLGLVIVGGIGGAARDAWLDRTPRRPFEWHRPELEWWAHRQTKREQARSSIAMEAKR